MKNREFRELQVSSTQLAIIFFGILIIGVVIFLLGVSVGKKHAQAALRTSRQIAEKAPEAVQSKLVVPEAKPETRPEAELPKPAATEKGDSPPAKTEPAPPQVKDKPAVKVAPASAPSAKAESAAPKIEPASAERGKPEPGAAETPAPPKKGLYYVQVGALATRTEASTVSQRYRTQGYPVVVFEPQPADKKTVYRVRLGGYATKDEAEAVRARLAAGAGRRVDYFIVRD